MCGIGRQPQRPTTSRVGNATGTTAKDSNSEANSIHVLMTLRHERVITVTGISVKPNQGTTILLPPIPTPHPPPKPIGLSPTISSVIPAVAASGDGITITGTGFGTEQGSSYVLFSDGGVNWGAPGDLANFQIDGWTDTQIQFTVPEPSGPQGVWAVNPGSTATVLVAIPGLTPNTVLRSSQVPILITTAPTIAGLSVAQAGPGDTVVVTGRYFGAEQQHGYLQFSDNGVNWGAPADIAPFTLVSWSDTQIVFRNSAPVWWLGNDVRHERHSYGDQRCRGDLKPSRSGDHIRSALARNRRQRRYHNRQQR